jgi:DNA-directed RNA polymerase alpha subunit
MASPNKHLKTCKNGHTFNKTSDCPVCPQCESERKPEADFLSKLAAPARRALENNDILTLEKLAKYTEEELLQFHGLGKSSIPKIESLLSEKRLRLKIYN